MPAWEEYPSDYRSREVAAIRTAALAGECVAVIGLSGSGKSNLLGFLFQRCNQPALFSLVDCNRLLEKTPTALFRLMRRSLAGGGPAEDELDALQTAIQERLDRQNGRLCILLDRFDALGTPGSEAIASGLRALRDAFKYQLTLVTATRRPLDPHSEMAELFYAHTLWLGPLSPENARWSAASYAQRKGLAWDEAALAALCQHSGGYPSFLRAACEAYAEGCALNAAALATHPAVQRRLAEFWSDSPASSDLQNSGLSGHPWLHNAAPTAFDTTSLTALEHRLLAYLQAHPNQVCDKEELIPAVWPEDKVYEQGIRDDSLAQLVRRLRQKIEPDPSTPTYLHNVPGRGYRFTPGK